MYTYANRTIKVCMVGDGEGDGDDAKLDGGNNIIIDRDLLCFTTGHATLA